ncbi:hypothetical protein E4191_07640 [Paracoccus liaowanqingii]|uniref:Uncharacterized protein n=1 Tax=Paracoccus liaowanqingii TaxID=2560053 RepID=A0A4P7HMP3_9RHOB|nr:hypothetical protein [Paracoccus liaowanqingii]QBX34597.1 hypothetical protein E4191_07640 [Paracoccus liaowanqingii]
MKIEITKRGVYDGEGKQIPVGTQVTVKGDTVPGYLLNKGRVIGETEGKTPVTNPAQDAQASQSGPDRQELLKMAATVIDPAGFLADGRPDVRAINAELIDDAAPFTAEERDTLWPGIAAAVAADRQAG